MQKPSARSEFGRMLRNRRKKNIRNFTWSPTAFEESFEPISIWRQKRNFRDVSLLFETKIVPEPFYLIFPVLWSNDKRLRSRKIVIKNDSGAAVTYLKEFLLLWPQREWFDPSFCENDSKWVKEKSEKWNLSFKLLISLCRNRSDTLKLLHNDFFVSQIKALSLAP